MTQKFKVDMEDSITVSIPGTGDLTCFRIIATKHFSDVKLGDLGGYVSSYHNLDQDGDCWVKSGAVVCQLARVTENAVISDAAVIAGHARISGNAKVSLYAFITDRVKIYENAAIAGGHYCDNVHVRGGVFLINQDNYVNGNYVIAGDMKVATLVSTIQHTHKQFNKVNQLSNIEGGRNGAI